MFPKLYSGLLAGAVTFFCLTLPLIDAKSGHTMSLPVPLAFTDNGEPPPLPQDVIVRENEQAWRQTLERIEAGLPSEIRPPRAFSDLSARNRARCDSRDQVTFGERMLPCWLVETILQAADETGTDPVYLMALADKESSFRPNARASTSTASGLFQFLNGTWLELIRDYGARHNLVMEAAAIRNVNGKPVIGDPEIYRRVMDLRNNPYVAALMAGEMLKRDMARVEQRVGRELYRSEYYFTHFLGVASASRLILANALKPTGAATGLLPRAARANRSLFVSRQGRKRRSVTVAEFHQRLEDMMEQRMERYEEVKETVLAEADKSAVPKSGNQFSASNGAFLKNLQR